MARDWQPDSWRGRPVQQMPAYADVAALAEVERQARRLSAAGLRRRGARAQGALAEVCAGRAFLLQGGDCAEAFADFEADKIRDTLARAAADGGGAHLRRRPAGGEGRPDGGPVRQAALVRHRGDRRRRAAELPRRHRQRDRVRGRRPRARPGAPAPGLLAGRRHAQPAARLHPGRLRLAHPRPPVDPGLPRPQPAGRALPRHGATGSPRRSSSCAPAASPTSPRPRSTAPASTPPTRRCCSASSRR